MFEHSGIVLYYYFAEADCGSKYSLEEQDRSRQQEGKNIYVFI